MKLFHHALICILMSFITYLSFTFESACQVLFSFPSLSPLLVTVESSSASITASKVLSSDIIRFSTSKNVATPVFLLASSDRMMQGSIFLLDGRFIISDNIRPSKSIRLAHSQVLLAFRDCSFLHNLALTLSTEDIRVLIRLARRPRLNWVCLELAVSNLLLLVLQGYGIRARIFEAEVRLESIRGSHVVDSIMRVNLRVGMEVGTNLSVVAISCEHI